MKCDTSISCIIPTLNRGMVLCDSIKGLLNQTFPAHEIIVVDQTPVQPSEVARQLQHWQDDGLIQLLHQSQPNASAARNRGAQQAKGEILLFLDDDIEVHDGFLAAYAEAFSNPAVRGVAGQVLEGNCEVMDKLPVDALNPEHEWMFFPRNYAHPLVTGWLISCNAAVRKNDFFAVGGMDENYPRGAYREEADFGRRWTLSGRRFHFLPSCSLHHLGITKVPGGGARNWTQDGPLIGYHHYVGEWYFFLGFATRKNWKKLLSGWYRSAGFTKRNLMRPWWIPVTFVRWISALPIAAWLRLQGPKLAPPPQTSI